MKYTYNKLILGLKKTRVYSINIQNQFELSGNIS